MCDSACWEMTWMNREVCSGILPVCVSVCLCLSCAQSFLPVIDVLCFCPRQVREILGQCSCPAQFPMIKVSEGKYKVGDSSALIFIRVRGPSTQHHKHRNLWMSFSTHFQDTSNTMFLLTQNDINDTGNH